MHQIFALLFWAENNYFWITNLQYICTGAAEGSSFDWLKYHAYNFQLLLPLSHHFYYSPLSECFYYLLLQCLLHLNYNLDGISSIFGLKDGSPLLDQFTHLYSFTLCLQACKLVTMGLCNGYLGLAFILYWCRLHPRKNY